MGKATQLFGTIPRPIQVVLFAIPLLMAYATPPTVAPVPVSPMVLLGLAGVGSVAVTVAAVYTDAISRRATGGFLVGSLVGWFAGSLVIFSDIGSVLVWYGLALGIGLIGSLLATR